MAEEIIVIGGGAAGMMAGIMAARAGARVRLLERNEKLGRKLYITGKGRCNVTNAADREVFMTRIFRNPRFMYAAFSVLDNRATMDFFDDCGTPLKVERGDRVFPESDRSADIIDALKYELQRLRVAVEFGVRVTALLLEDGVCRGVRTEDGRELPCGAVIVATGGLSYPSTGSTGDGYELARTAGLEIKPLLPSLVPVETKESWPGTLSGLSLKNVKLSAYVQGKKKEKCIYAEQGEMLFTHFGISGPLVLTLSALLPEELTGVRLSLDLKPALDEQTLDARLLRDFKELSRKQITAVMDGLVPHALGRQLLVLSGIPASMPVNSVTAEMRKRLISVMKGIELTPVRRRGYDEAIVTRGGVDVKGIDPSTMRVKQVSGLYFAGEVLDVDATTGGFNLQIAFSTGALAGRSAAEAVKAMEV